MGNHRSLLVGLLLGLSVSANGQNGQGQLVADLAFCHLEVREASDNWSPDIKLMLADVCINKPAYWCGAFAFRMHKLAKVEMPKPHCNFAWTPNWFPKDRIVWRANQSFSNIMVGDVIGLYYPRLGRIGHVEVIVGLEYPFVVTIGGNTNPAGGRSGQGVHKHRRHIDSIKYIGRWWTGPLK